MFKIIILTLLNVIYNVHALGAELNQPLESVVQDTDKGEEKSEDLVENDDKILDNDSEFFTLLRKSSLLHSEEELSELDKVIDALKSGAPINRQDLVISTDDDIKEESDNKNTHTSGISFYLNSILYYSKYHWTIWINGNKITQDSNTTDLIIIEVRENYIKCRWSTGYGKFVKSLGNLKAQNLLPNFTTVRVNDNIATVEFLLRPNQSFKMNNTLTIKEGH